MTISYFRLTMLRAWLGKTSHYMYFQAPSIESTMVFYQTSSNTIFHMIMDRTKDIGKEGYVLMNMFFFISGDPLRAYFTAIQ